MRLKSMSRHSPVKKKTGPEGMSSHQVDYLLNGWFPVNGKLLRRVQDKFSSNCYANSSEVVDEIINDFALFTYTLRRFLGKVEPESRGIELNPVKMLRQADLQTLETILMNSSVSTHSFSDMMRDQAACLKSTVMSSSTAEMLGEKAGISKGLAFSTSLLRQVGLNLVAWNYPRIYTKAVARLSSEGSNLERELFKVLGFSPRAMGVKLALPGPLHPGLGMLLGERDQEEAEKPESFADEECTLAMKFCEMGELFARINDPEHFVIPQKEWETLISDINYHLGGDGVSKVLARINEEFSHYGTVSPRLLDGSLTPEKNVRLSGLYHGKRLLQANTNIAKCSDVLRTKFQSVYSALVPGEVSIRALEILLSEVIPRAGFGRGCIYLMDNTNNYLVPRLKIGEAEIQRYRAIRCETEVFSDNPIVNALFSSFPLIQKDVIMHGERVSHISGSLGTGEKAGVLYLELSDGAIESLSNEQSIFFRAIQQAINDCLGI